MPRKFGQHFLARRSVLERIAEAVTEIEPELPLVEIGPGRGALTEHLVKSAPRLVAIEVDPVLVHYLQEKFRGEENFALLHSDVMRTDLAQWGRVRIVGNLPYYITSPIVDKTLALGDSLAGAVFLVQREVAERMAAAPGRRDYGFLSVHVQAFAEATILMHVPPDAFRPPPKVESAVIRLLPRRHPAIPDPDSFLQFASAAFRHKRKTLRNNLSGHFPPDVVRAQPEAGKRAEQLSLEELAAMHQRILRGS